MKKVLAGLAAISILFVSMPAFACGGDKQAKKGHDEPMMTSVDEQADETKADDSKETKDETKEEATEEQSGEV